jgi:hypothetical protein
VVEPANDLLAPKGGVKTPPFLFVCIFISKVIYMKQIVLTESQLQRLKKNLKEDKDGSYMAKQQMFTIATLAYKMWELMDENEDLEDWMESKIAQSEMSIVSVVKAYMYDEVEDKISGTDQLDFNELVIGT